MHVCVAVTAVQDSLKAELMNVTAASQATHAGLLAERQVLTEQLAEGMNSTWTSMLVFALLFDVDWSFVMCIFTKPASS